MAQQGPVAVIVGVGPGTGAALARRFAKGYRVGLIARSNDYLKELGSEIRAAGGEALETPTDVGNFSEVATAFAAIREQLGNPQVLLYNAGSGVWGTIIEITPEQYEAAWRVNALGAFMCAKEVAPAMIERGQGVM